MESLFPWSFRVGCLILEEKVGGHGRGGENGGMGEGSGELSTRGWPSNLSATSLPLPPSAITPSQALLKLRRVGPGVWATDRSLLFPRGY